MHFLVGVANPLFGKCQTCTKTHHETVFIKKKMGTSFSAWETIHSTGQFCRLRQDFNTN